MAKLPPSPFIDPDHNRWDELYNEDDLWKAIFDDPLPAFISDPSREYMAATEIRPIVDVLAGHMRS